MQTHLAIGGVQAAAETEVAAPTLILRAWIFKNDAYLFTPLKEIIFIVLVLGGNVHGYS